MPLLTENTLLASITHLTEKLCSICHMAWREELLSGWSGNASIRVPKSDFVLITAASVPKGSLTAEDCLLMDLDGNVYGSDKKASSEWKVHAALYAQAPQCEAILHTHPANMQALNLVLQKSGNAWQKEFLALELYEAEVWKTKLHFSEACAPGSGELAQTAGSALRQAKEEPPCGVWLQNHGLCAMGRTLDEAFRFTEELEHLARVQLMYYSALKSNPQRHLA